MAEEVIIKVDGLQDLQQIENTFKSFTVSINAAVQAIGGTGNDSLKKEIANLTKEIERLKAAQQQTNTVITQSKVERQQLNKIEKDSLILTSQYASSTEKLAAQIRILQREIDSLVASGQTESNSYREKFAQLKRMTTEYQNLEKATGKAQMKSTGMYGATYQLSQVMRELPNFAIDARIGFLSLSNNLPMLLDSFQQLSMQINEVTGKAYGFKGAFKQFAGSLISLNTLFIIGTTLLTLYGEKIIDWISGISDADRINRQFLESLKSTSSELSNMTGEVERMELLFKLAKEGTIENDKVLNEYNETLGKIFGEQTNINDANQAFIDNKEKFKGAIVELMYVQAIYSAAIKKSAEAVLESYTSPKWYDKLFALTKYEVNRFTSRFGLELFETATNPLASAQQGQLVSNLKTQAQTIFDDWDSEMKKLAEKYPQFSDYLLGIDKGKNKIKTGTKTKQEKVKIIEFDTDEAEKYFTSLATWYDDWVKSLSAKKSDIALSIDEDVKSANEANLQIIKEQQANELFREKQREATRQAQLDTLVEIGTITNSIVGLYDARIERLNNYYDLEEARIEGSLMSEEAKNAALKTLDERRYKEELALFEQRKSFQVAIVWMDAAVGIMNAWTEKSIAISPFDVILRVAKTTAILAQATAQTANINAQKPNAPKAIGGGGSSIGSMSAMTALSPQKSALTSNEDNLNTILGNNKVNTSAVVKVSEINKVQNNVKVRETNQSY